MAIIRVTLRIETELDAADLLRKLTIVSTKMGDVVSSSMVPEVFERTTISDRVLYLLRDRGDRGEPAITQAQIARVLGLKAPAISKAMKRLQHVVEQDSTGRYYIP